MRFNKADTELVSTSYSMEWAYKGMFALGKKAGMSNSWWSFTLWFATSLRMRALVLLATSVADPVLFDPWIQNRKKSRSRRFENVVSALWVKNTYKDLDASKLVQTLWKKNKFPKNLVRVRIYQSALVCITLKLLLLWQKYVRSVSRWTVAPIRVADPHSFHPDPDPAF